MRRWIEPEDLPLAPELLALVGGERTAAQALARRGFADPAAARAFLDPGQYTPSQPEDLPGMVTALERLAKALDRREPVLVWGDFDVDGQTAAALLVDMLTELGGVVRYHIPVRAVESHGVSQPVLQSLLEGPEGPPALLLTCDTGIAAFEALEYARRGGLDVIVTDHHELARIGDPPKPALPPALAVITPRRLPDGHALSGLPGVGVAYKLAEGLYRTRGNPQGAQRHLDLAALGIVADVALQTGDTRYLLQRGLEKLRSTARIGLQAIYERLELNPQRITEEQIGFILGPRLNALGRLADANPAVELLTTADMGRARLLALELEGLNSRRQLLTSQVLQGALSQIEQEPELAQLEALVLAHPAWPAGVVGIVASRLVELFGKPAVLIAAPPGEAARGSARSIEGVDITAAIAAASGTVGSSSPDLLLGYGGHAMAAGFSIEAEHITEFRRRLARAVAAQMAEKSVQPAGLQIEAYIDWSDVSLELANSLERLAPFGAGNPAPVLASRGLRLVNASAFGRQRDHLQLVIEDENGSSRRVIWWGAGEYEHTERLPQAVFDLAYTLRATAYRGEPELSIQFEDFRIDESILELAPAKPALEVLDYRNLKDSFEGLKRLLDEPRAGDIQIWAEGEHPAQLRERLGDRLPLCYRDKLDACRTLVVWSAPPGLTELRAAISAAGPERVALFCVDSGLDQPEFFLKRLAGLVKYALTKRSGQTTLVELAGNTAQRELTVRFGLEWLKAMGHIDFRIDEKDYPSMETFETDVELRVSNAAAKDPDAAKIWIEQITTLINETRAYRKFLSRTGNVNEIFS